MKRFSLLFLAAAAVVTVAFGTIYAAVQQNWRMSAYFPLIQLVDEQGRAVEQGVEPGAVVGGGVDLKAHPVPFTIIYDQDHKVLASSGKIDGNTPELPSGVFGHVTIGHQDRLTWQPNSSQRFATVVAATSKDGKLTGYILAGQSLAETEDQIIRLGILVGFGWLCSLLVLAVSYLVVGKLKP